MKVNTLCVWVPDNLNTPPRIYSSVFCLCLLEFSALHTYSPCIVLQLLDIYVAQPAGMTFEILQRWRIEETPYIWSDQICM